MKYGHLKYLALLFLLQIYFLSNNFYSISADESGHTIEAYQFMIGEGSLFSIWLPFQKIFLAPFTMIDLFWTPRIISMIFGLAGLGLLMLLTKELFKNETVTIVSGILGATFIGISAFSVLPLTEIYFFTFLLLSVHLMLRKNDWIILSVIILTSIRYEGWIFAFVIAAMLYKELGLKVLLMFIFPLFWVILSYFETGSVLGFIHSVSGRKATMKAEDTVIYNFLYMGFTSLIILGLVFINKNKTYLWLFISTLLIWTIGTSISGAMATHNVWRVGLVWVLMLIPSTAYLVYRLYDYQKLFGIALFSVILYLAGAKIIDRANESYMKVEDLRAGKFLKTLDGNIIMPRYGWEFMNLSIFNTDIKAEEKITSVDGYDYLITMKAVKSLQPIYSNGKWFIYKLK